MSMKKNKRRTLLFIGLVVILLSGMWWSYYYAEKRNRYCLEVIKLDKDQGYGYNKGNRRLSINRLFLFCHKENHLRLRMRLLKLEI